MKEKFAGLIGTAFCRLTEKYSPDPHIWVFSSTENRYFNYNSKYLFLYVRSRCPDIRPLYVINDDVRRMELSAEYGTQYFVETKSMAGIRRVLRAGVWFTSAGLPVYGTGLSKDRRIINLWHGVPLKAIALRDRSESRWQRLYFRRIFSDNYTDVAATSKTVSRVMRAGLGVSEEKMRIWGQPRCDCLFEPFDRAAFLRAYFPELQDVKKIILYAPTFRKGEGVRLFPFDDFDRAALDAYLEREKILLCIRMHLNEPDSCPVPVSSHIRYFNGDVLEDIMEGLQAFDLLITDYSSIYIDYLLLDRPVIFLPYDLEAYSAGHGFAFPFERVTPGPKPQTFAAFLEAVDVSLRDPAADGYARERRKVRNLFYAEAAPCCGKITAAVRESIKNVK